MNQEQIKDILKETHKIDDPESLWYDIRIQGHSMKEPIQIRLDKTGVDMDSLEIEINSTIEYRDKGQSEHGIKLTDEEIVWDKFYEEIKNAIAGDLE